MTILVVALALLVTLGLMCFFAYRDKKDKQMRNKNKPEAIFASKSDKYIKLLKEGETYLLGDVSFRFYKMASLVIDNPKSKAITLYCNAQSSDEAKTLEMNVGVDYTHFDFEGKKYRIHFERSSNVFVLEFVQYLK